MNKYNQLREEIIKANSNLAELKFGSYITGMGYSNSRVVMIQKENIYLNKGNYCLVKENLKDIENKCRWENEISLEDCLIAIEKKIKTRIKLLEIIGAMTDEKGDTFWKFNVPLQDQSDECKELLWNLIYKK